jgi:hypothetical protein
MDHGAGSGWEGTMQTIAAFPDEVDVHSTVRLAQAPTAVWLAGSRFLHVFNGELLITDTGTDIAPPIAMEYRIWGLLKGVAILALPFGLLIHVPDHLRDKPSTSLASLRT